MRRNACAATAGVGLRPPCCPAGLFSRSLSRRALPLASSSAGVGLFPPCCRPGPSPRPQPEPASVAPPRVLWLWPCCLLSQKPATEASRHGTVGDNSPKIPCCAGWHRRPLTPTCLCKMEVFPPSCGPSPWSGTALTSVATSATGTEGAPASVNIEDTLESSRMGICDGR